MCRSKKALMNERVAKKIRGKRHKTAIGTIGREVCVPSFFYSATDFDLREDTDQRDIHWGKK